MITTKQLFYLNSLIFILIPFVGFTQNRTLSGEIINDEGAYIESANVLLVKSDNVILSFSISDKFGQFEIDVSSIQNTDSLYLEVQHVAYDKERRIISAKNAIYNFRLSPKLNALEEVLIREKPLAERFGDTLIYNVQKFSRKEDRSIGDVLRRMPGITVAVDGTIYYNNEEIENLYIHGDDLMAGKYGLATRVINKEDIISVDVIRNHQPIKVLQDKILSDRTSIDLRLKDENKLKLSAQATLGAGLPKQYDINFTPILLNKKVKFINQIASNNSGIDYRIDFKELGTENMLSSLQNDDISFSLSQGTVEQPDLSTKDFYINNSSSINFNNLYTYKSGLKIRLNIQGLIDKNRLLYTNEIINYTGSDTLLFFENQHVVNKPKIISSSINLMKNKESYFFNNDLKINYNKNDNYSNLIFNNESFTQNLKQDQFKISNDFSFIPELTHNGIAEIRLFSEISKKEDRLNINEDYRLNLSDIEQEYSNVKQKLKLPSIYINGSLSYKIPSNFINQDYRIGYIKEKRELNSNLFLNSAGGLFLYSGDSGNELNWENDKIYFISKLSLNTDKVRASLNLPINYQTINYFQDEYTLDKVKNNLFLNPSATFQYNFDLEKRLTLNYSHETNFGDISQIFRGIILQNYRTLISNNSNLQKSEEDFFDLKYSLENSATLMFFNGGLNYRKIKLDNIRSYTIEDNIIKSILLPLENMQNDTGLSIGMSKYLFKLKTKISLDARLNHSTSENIVNDRLAPFKSNSIFLNSNFSKSFFDIFVIDYSPKAIWNFSKFSSIENNLSDQSISYNTLRFEQNLNLTITPAKLWDLEIDSNYLLVDQNNFNSNEYLLFNLNFKHRFENNRFDLSLDITNLFDVGEYRLLSISQNQQINSNYQLRGRMIIGRLNWYF
tara:strand:- start:3968 stop:6664 length:2697 start_codon:yes stop_codon:yes gene_type:complete